MTVIVEGEEYELDDISKYFAEQHARAVLIQAQELIVEICTDPLLAPPEDDPPEPDGWVYQDHTRAMFRLVWQALGVRLTELENRTPEEDRLLIRWRMPQSWGTAMRQNFEGH